jgi:hypothetical protein
MIDPPWVKPAVPVLRLGAPPLQPTMRRVVFTEGAKAWLREWSANGGLGKPAADPTHRGVRNLDRF